MDTPKPSGSSHDEVSLKDVILSIREWLHYLLSKWKILVIALVVGALAGAAYSFFSPRKYVAKTTFVLDDDSQDGVSMGALAGLSSVLGSGVNDGSLFSGDNIIWLYTSNRMLGKTLLDTVSREGKTTTLINWLLQVDGDLKEVDNKLRNADKGYQGFPDQLLDRQQLSRTQGQLLNAAIAKIRSKYIQVSNEDNTVGIMGVTFTSGDERFSFVFDNKIVSLVNDFYINTKTKKEQEQVAVLQKKVDEFNKSMGASMHHAANAADAIPNANPTLRVLQVKPQREIVDVQVNSAIYTTMVQQLEMAKVALAKETPLIQVVDAPELPLVVKKPSLVFCIIVFGFLACLFAMLYLIATKFYKDVIDN